MVRNTIHLLLSPMESHLLDRLVPENLPQPIFILGAPRSGTTLLYELLVTCYEFSYFTNLANTFYKTPLAVSKLGDRFKHNWHGNQESNFGTVKGFGAPSEAGSIWGRWIPEFEYLDERDAEVRLNSLNRADKVIQTLQLVQGAPFINKNVMHSVHIRLLNVAFPGCLFIDLRREKKANIRSIVRARQKAGGPALDADGWWSVRPRGVDSWCGLSIEEQACAQVVMLRKDIEESFGSIGENRRIIVNYEDICRKPASALEQISTFLKSTSSNLERRHPLPAAIKLSPSPIFDSGIERVIEQALESLEEN